MTTEPTTSKKSPRAATGATTARVEQMRAQAFEMLVRGIKCPEIGRVLGVSRNRAWQLATEGLAQLKAETMDKAEQYRLMLTERHMRRLALLDEIIESKDDKGVYNYDANARITASSQARGIEQEIAKLWGAYMPDKSEVSGPNGMPLQTQAVTPSEHDLSNLSSEQLAQLMSLVALLKPTDKDASAS